MKQEFKDYWRKEPKNALVTGASSGMGLCYAEKLAEKGYNVLLISIDEKAMADVAEGLQKRYPNQRIEYLVKDLAEDNAAEELYEYTVQNGFNVNLLINNAGIFTFKDVLDMSLKKIETFIGLHVSTVTKLCRLFGEQMSKDGGGRIINMSSISAHTPYCGIALYTATKSYLLVFTKAFALEMKERNVKVSAVCPGAVATGLYKLPVGLQKLGIFLGIIIPPQRLVKRVLKANRRGKITIIPGFGNRLFKPIFSILPTWFKLLIRRRIKRLENNF